MIIGALRLVAIEVQIIIRLATGTIASAITAPRYEFDMLRHGPALGLSARF